jgi:hypothetical protein
MLKEFLTQLPECLLSNKLCPLFIEAIKVKDTDERIRRIRWLVSKTLYNSSTVDVSVVYLEGYSY